MLLALYRIGATLVLVAPKLLLAIAYNIATAAGETGHHFGRYSILSNFSAIWGAATSIMFPPWAASASFFRTYR